LHADLLFVDKSLPFLIVVAKPLELVLVKPLTGRTAAVLFDALSAIIQELKKRGFIPRTLLSDGEGGIAKIATRFADLIFNPAGAGQHVPVVENMIRQLKERVRAILSGLPYTAPPFLVKWAVLYGVNCLNMFPSGTRVDQSSSSRTFPWSET
jgi:hypothetical protein